MSPAVIILVALFVATAALTGLLVWAKLAHAQDARLSDGRLIVRPADRIIGSDGAGSLARGQDPAPVDGDALVRIGQAGAAVGLARIQSGRAPDGRARVQARDALAAATAALDQALADAGRPTSDTPAPDFLRRPSALIVSRPTRQQATIDLGPKKRRFQIDVASHPEWN